MYDRLYETIEKRRAEQAVTAGRPGKPGISRRAGRVVVLAGIAVCAVGLLLLLLI